VREAGSGKRSAVVAELHWFLTEMEQAQDATELHVYEPTEAKLDDSKGDLGADALRILNEATKGETASRVEIVFTNKVRLTIDVPDDADEESED
jgi:hypothetical protein